MMPKILLAGSLLALAACSAAPSRPEKAPEWVPARLEAPAPRPLEIVEVPKPIPFPAQLKPLPELSSIAKESPPKESVLEANAAARIEPTASGFVDAVQVWPYSPGALYQVYTMPGRTTDIALAPGEDIIDISTPDTVRWIVGDSRSGSGAEERRHVIVKPTKAGLETNLTILTSLRVYHLEVKATPETWLAAVSWDYPQERLSDLRIRNQKADAEVPLASGVKLEQLKFRYDIAGDDVAWRPLHVFDDGQKVYIQFPDSIAQGDMPPLFVVGERGDAQLVNYRARAPYYIVDRLFEAAELRLGGEKDAHIVRIVRNDLPSRSKRARR